MSREAELQVATLAGVQAAGFTLRQQERFFFEFATHIMRAHIDEDERARRVRERIKRGVTELQSIIVTSGVLTERMPQDPCS